MDLNLRTPLSPAPATAAVTPDAQAASGDDVDSIVRALYRTLTPAQRGEICFAWDHADEARGVVRTFIANHWQVTRPCVRSAFFSADQQRLIYAIYLGLLAPEWHARFVQQLADDTYGHPWGADQSVAIFGDPERGPWQFVFTGRHVTLRADGGSEPRVAFGGPILYAHQATGYYEKPHHPRNVFWPQAQAASRLFDMLDAGQQSRSTVAALPPETELAFGAPPAGLPVADLHSEQRAALDGLIDGLLAPFRDADRTRVRTCLAAQGGLDRCHLSYALDGRMSAPLWDNWRLAGPAFIWHWRGYPHVHVWVHVASDPAVPANARRGQFLFDGHDRLMR